MPRVDVLSVASGLVGGALNGYFEMPRDVLTWVSGLVGGALVTYLAYRSQRRAMGAGVWTLWKERSLRRRHHISRAVRRGERLSDPGDAALAVWLARYRQANLRSKWSKIPLTISAVLLGGLGIVAAITDGPAWLALTAGSLMLSGALILFGQRTLRGAERAERANRIPGRGQESVRPSGTRSE